MKNSSPAEYQRRPGRTPGRSGRRPGASGAREAILAAAARRFAAQGYDRASLRAIAADAGVDQKLIAHYFGSKQRLFVAAVGLPLNPAELLPALLAGPRDQLGERLTELLRTTLEDPRLLEALTGLVRAAASEPEVARMMREFLAREALPRVAEALDGDEPRLRVNLVWSQFMGLIVARAIVGVEPLASLPAAVVAAAVAPSLERFLVGPLPPPRRATRPT